MWYLIHVIIYTALLFGIYWLLLRDKAIHWFNRIYLLMTLLLPLLLPFITIPWLWQRSPGAAISGQSVLLPVLQAGGRAVETLTPAVHSFPLLSFLYWGVTLLLVVRLAGKYWHLLRFIHRSTRIKEDEIIWVKTDEVSVGSWFHYVFISSDDIADAVLQHERAHVRLLHSIDILIAQAIQVIFWCNPLLPVIIRELRIVHEFQADELAVTHKESYAKLLLNEQFLTNHFSLIHTFFHHPLKRRIMMLYNETKSYGRIRQTLAFSFSGVILTAAIALQSCDKSASGPAKATVQQTEGADHLSITIPGKPADASTEVIKGMDGIMQFLGNHLRYPDYATKNRIEGKVMVKLEVNNEGYVTKATIVKTPDSSLTRASMEALAQIKSWQLVTDKGTDVQQVYTLPISFKMQDMSFSGAGIEPTNTSFFYVTAEEVDRTTYLKERDKFLKYSL